MVIVDSADNTRSVFHCVPVFDSRIEILLQFPNILLGEMKCNPCIQNPDDVDHSQFRKQFLLCHFGTLSLVFSHFPIRKELFSEAD